MGAENRNHPPRPHPRETLLPCRHAASPCPSAGDRPLLVGRTASLAQGQGGQGHDGDPLSFDLGPLEAKPHQLGGGRRSLSQGKLMPSWRRGEGAPSQTGHGCQCNSKGQAHLCVGAKRSPPRPSQANLHGLCHPPLPLRALLTLGPGLSRGGAAADGMYGLGMFLGRACAAGDRGSISGGLAVGQPLSLSAEGFCRPAIQPQAPRPSLLALASS